MESTGTGQAKQGKLAERQRALRAETMRREIVGAALSEFAERGVADTSIANIADRLGTGGSTIYHYFPSKQAILEQALDETLAHIAESLIQTVGSTRLSPAEFPQAAMTVANRILDVLTESPHTVTLIGHVATSSDAELRGRWFNGVGAVTSLLQQVLRNGVEDKTFKPSLDVEATATALVAMPLGIVVFQGKQPVDREAWQRVSRAIVDLIVDGILAEQ